MSAFHIHTHNEDRCRFISMLFEILYMYPFVLLSIHFILYEYYYPFNPYFMFPIYKNSYAKQYIHILFQMYIAFYMSHGSIYKKGRKGKWLKNKW